MVKRWKPSFLSHEFIFTRSTIFISDIILSAAKLAEFPRLIEIAARSNEPHRIAFYLYDLASEFHALWNKGNEHPELRFLQGGNLATSQAKIALIRATAVVISNGLGILGVQAAQEMR